MGRQKLKDVPIVADDLNAVLDMSIQSIKLGRPPKFDDTPEGLEDFKQASIAYLEHVRRVNNNPENEHHLIPDTESWAVFCGTTRMTILNYEKSRDDDWKQFIGLMKSAITACKKQLAFRQKIPTVLIIFDLVNNAGYLNASEYKLQLAPKEEEKRVLTADQLPKLNILKDEIENQATLPHL